MSDEYTIILVDEFDWCYAPTSEPPTSKSAACEVLQRVGCEEIDTTHRGLIIAHARGSVVLMQLSELRNGRGVAGVRTPNLYDRAYFLRDGYSDLREF